LLHLLRLQRTTGVSTTATASVGRGVTSGASAIGGSIATSRTSTKATTVASAGVVASEVGSTSLIWTGLRTVLESTTSASP
jgi:hypothetical protein